MTFFHQIKVKKCLLDYIQDEARVQKKNQYNWLAFHFYFFLQTKDALEYLPFFFLVIKLSEGH